MSEQLPISNARVVKLLSRAKFVVSVLLLFRQNNDCDHHHITGCIKKKKTNTDSKTAPFGLPRLCLGRRSLYFFRNFYQLFFFRYIVFHASFPTNGPIFAQNPLTDANRRLCSSRQRPCSVLNVRTSLRGSFVRDSYESKNNRSDTARVPISANLRIVSFAETYFLPRNSFFEKFLDSERQCIRVDINFCANLHFNE